MKSSSGTAGQMSLLEIFVNRRKSTDVKTNIKADFQSDDSYNTYGKYFDMDTTNGLNKLYVSSYRLNSNPSAHQINTLQVCTHLQTYSSGTDTCSSVSSGSISIDQQSATAVTCANNDDSITYNRLVGESLCNYG